MKNPYLIIGALVMAASSAHAGERVQATVKGMVCGFCAQGIEKKFSAEPAVSKVDVSLKDHLVTLDLKDKQSIADEKVTQILKDAGYSVEKIERK